MPTEPAQGRLAVTLSSSAATAAKKMAADIGVTVPEVVRRGLSLFQLYQSLESGEYLMVKRNDSTLERVVLWPND